MMKYPVTFEEAEVFERYATHLVARNIAHSTQSRSAETLEHLRAIQALVPPGTYRHFKGGEYTVVRVLERVNTGLCDVEYFAHYGKYEGEHATRDLIGPDSFLRPVNRPEYNGVRFTKLD